MESHVHTSTCHYKSTITRLVFHQSSLQLLVRPSAPIVAVYCRASMYCTVLHCTVYCRASMSDWVDTIHSIVTLSPAASQWLTDFLSSEDGLKYVKPFLVESGARDVRTSFSQLLDKCLASQASHAAGSPAAAAIIQHIVSLLSAEGGVGDNVKYSSQYFWLLSMFAQMVPYQQ